MGVPCLFDGFSWIENSVAPDLPQAPPAMPQKRAIWRRNRPFHQVSLEIGHLGRYGGSPQRKQTSLF
jgi:hypothetical protein